MIDGVEVNTKHGGFSINSDNFNMTENLDTGKTTVKVNGRKLSNLTNVKIDTNHLKTTVHLDMIYVMPSKRKNK